MPRLSAVALLLSVSFPCLGVTPIVQFSRRFNEQAQASTFDVKTDAAGNIYLCGFAFSPGFPLVHPLQTTGAIFLTKLDPSGAIVYSTMLGTGPTDTLGGMAVDPSGNVYLTGSTISPKFPVTANAVQTTLAGQADAFVMKIDPTGQRILYSTLLGGRLNDVGLSIALDAAGAIYVAGATPGGDFPVTPGGSLAEPGKMSLFVTKLVPDGSFLQYSTLVENASLYRVRVAVTNLTEAAVLINDGLGARILKLNAAGDRLVYRSVMPSGVVISALASDATGFIWAAGGASVAGLATPDAAQAQFGGTAYFRSVDGGKTWIAGGEGLDVGSINQIVPLSGKLYAGTDQGLFQSDDRGGHWNRLLGDPVLHFAADPSATGTLYVSRRGQTPLAKTVDGGVTWQDLDPGAPANPPLMGLAVDPRNPATIYAGAAKVYRSDDGGVTWTASGQLPGNGIVGMAVDPSNSVLYISLSITYAGCGIAPCIPVTPGIVRSIDGGRTFQSSSVNNYTSGFVVDPATSGTVYAAGSLIYRTVDYGAHWTSARGPSPDAYPVVAVQFDDSGALLALGTDGRVFRSTDGGDTFSQATDFRIGGATTLAVADGVIHLGGRRGSNVFVAKLDLSGNISYATYWGGRVLDSASGITLDQDGNVYVGGAGSSPDFPERNEAREFSGGSDAFVVKLDPAGGVVYSTYWGGSAGEQTNAIATGPDGKVYFTGSTGSSDFPAAQRGTIFLVGLQ